VDEFVCRNFLANAGAHSNQFAHEADAACLFICFDVICESGCYADNQDRSIVINRKQCPVTPATPHGAQAGPLMPHSDCNTADVAAAVVVV
jgi:hypothetical protein